MAGQVKAADITRELRVLGPGIEPLTTRSLGSGKFEIHMPAAAARNMGFHSNLDDCSWITSYLTRHLGGTVELTEVRQGRPSSRGGRTYITLIAG